MGKVTPMLGFENSALSWSGEIGGLVTAMGQYVKGGVGHSETLPTPTTSCKRSGCSTVVLCTRRDTAGQRYIERGSSREPSRLRGLSIHGRRARNVGK